MLLPRVVKRLVFSLKSVTIMTLFLSLLSLASLRTLQPGTWYIHYVLCFTCREAFFLWAVTIFVSLSYYFSVTTHVRSFIPNINCRFSLSLAFTVSAFLLLIFLLLLQFSAVFFLICALSFGDWKLGFYQGQVP